MPNTETIKEVLNCLIDDMEELHRIYDELAFDMDADRITEIKEALIDVLAYTHAHRSSRILLRKEIV